MKFKAGGELQELQKSWKKEKNEKSGRKIKWEKLDHRLQTWLFRAITHQESSEDLPDSDGDHVGGQLEQEEVPDRLGRENEGLEHENDGMGARQARQVRPGWLKNNLLR